MRILIIVLLLLTSANLSFSQEIENTSEKSMDIKVVPYVSYNRTYEFMFGAVPMAMYKFDKKDTISPPSISGLMGIYTTNKTWFALMFSKLYINEDRWRMTIAAGLGNANSQFLSGGTTSNFIDYQTGADFFKLEVQRKIGKGLYLGGNYMFTKFNNEFAFDTPVTEEITLNGLGFVMLRDKRNNVYYPTKGSEFNFDYTLYAEFMGNDEESSKIELQYNYFIKSKRPQDVIALRGYGAFGLGEVPFNNLIVVEGTDLRGYSQGEYRGKQLVALQGEYRYNFKTTMGLVGFAGLGAVYGSNIDSNDGKILPSIGVGYRYMAFPENKMNVGLDIAAGKDDWGVYFRIGEAF
ncbi:BamA/TamA family outer membrane protein [Gilvibacter sp.]|uniref:BamA/TamA family outer membrane protein n=1 Tax=Gilvibacter sp. TaxID=2729997 RepID=UPI0025BCF9F7|nr:BamA/TamA family outer membrane protein [Gilvibacter sp.]NQX77654.1 BamA/TamA family outer membrane protein [Gilvibacter sp.]